MLIKRMLISILLIGMPLLMYLNLGAKMNDRNFIGMEVALDIVETFPRMEDTINVYKQLERDMKELAIVFSSENDSSTWDMIKAFFRSIYLLILYIIKFVISIVTDIVSIISWTFGLSRYFTPIA